MRTIGLRHLCRLFALIVLGCGQMASAATIEDRAPDLVLKGVLTHSDHQTYREVPFRVPAGVSTLTVTFDYSGRQDRAVVDLGLRDPKRFRGWSGGNKSRLVLEEADATPSYLPGPLPKGTWHLVLGVPNLRKDKTAAYEARIWFGSANAAGPGERVGTMPREGRWYRGDLHLHSGHSDGVCASRLGSPVPCPVFKTLDAAVARGLDFVAVTDHNATSQNAALRELAPYYDDLLLIPGREITTFHGHANVFGVTGPLDFQLGGPRLPSLGKLLDQVDAAHGVLSINHPGLPSGEACMGCGWSVPDTDWARIKSLEVINGGGLALFGAEGPLSGLPLWEAKLNQGLRITAIGGSDNHNPTGGAAVGTPTTVVHASELSQAAILHAITQGHVFVDVWGSGHLTLTVEARLGAQVAEMGDLLVANLGDRVRFEVKADGLSQDVRLSFAGNGVKVPASAGETLRQPAGSQTFEIIADGRPSWIRIDLRDLSGKLLVLGNPIYLRSGPTTK
jgi:hypothetical protein